MSRLDELLKEDGKDLVESFKKIGRSHVGLRDLVYQKDVNELETSLTFGVLSDELNTVSITEALHNKQYEGLPIKTLFIPYTPEGALLVDDSTGTVGTDVFYVVENEVIQPVITKEPVQLDGLFLPGVELSHYTGSQDILVQGNALQSLTEDKLRTKEVLSEAGLTVPFGYELIGNDFDDLTALVRFQRYNNYNGFAVKGNAGKCGRYVQMFENDQVEDAFNFIHKIKQKQERIFLESRLHPIPMNGQEDLDWKVRALTLLSDNPRFIGGAFIYDFRSGNPVGVSNGAEAVDLRSIEEYTGVPLDKIESTVVFATKVLYQTVKDAGSECAGVVAWDLLIPHGGINIIEVNSGLVAGAAKISRDSQLDSIVPELVQNYGAFLHGNHQKRKSVDAYERLTPSSFGRHVIGRTSFRTDNYSEALYQFSKIIDSDSNEASLIEAAYCKLAMSLLATQDKGTFALPVVLEAVERFPNSAPVFSALGAVYRAMGHHEDAVSAYKDSLPLNPHSETPRYLSLSLRALGRTSEADNYSEQLRRMDYDKRIRSIELKRRLCV